MIVVSNTSPLVNLAMVGQLDLLRRLYGQVTIPQAVHYEIAVAGAGQAGSAEVGALSWIVTKPVTDRALVTSLRLELDEGEAEAIALAVQLQADMLLLDERRGRVVASRLGIRHIGLLGVLAEAKHKRLIIAIRPIVDDLIGKAGFWISPRLYEHILHTVGE